MAGASTFSLMLRLGFGMLIVMGVMLLATGVLKRRGLVSANANGAAPRIDVIARRGLGKHASVAIVRTGGRDLVVGITDQHVTLLRETVAIPSEETAIDLDREAAVFVSSTATSTVEGQPSEPSEPTERHGTALPSGGQFATPGQAWKTMLENLRERSVRR